MTVLEKKQKDQLKELFQGLSHDVKVIMFKGAGCRYCDTTKEMLEEVAGLSEKIELEVHDFEGEDSEAKKYGVDKVPAIVVAGEKDYGIRFYGVPAGYEFTTLIEDVIHVGSNRHGLEQEVLDELARIDRPVKMEVMVTTQCPYCPMAVRAAHRLAMASEHITAEMVETSEFPEMVEKYEVQGVPHTVIDGFYSFIGPLPELDTAYEILRAMGKEAPPVHPRQEEVTAADEIEQDQKHAHRHSHGSGDGKEN